MCVISTYQIKRFVIDIKRNISIKKISEGVISEKGMQYGDKDIDP